MYSSNNTSKTTYNPIPYGTKTIHDSKTYSFNNLFCL